MNHILEYRIPLHILLKLLLSRYYLDFKSSQDYNSTRFVTTSGDYRVLLFDVIIYCRSQGEQNDSI